MEKSLYYITLIALASLTMLSGCKGNDQLQGNPYLEFDGISKSVNVGVEGIKKSNRVGVIIRSNSDWKLSLGSSSDSTWLHCFINEGKEDGIIYYWVDANSEFTERSGVITFTNEGNVLNQLKIIQDASQPLLEIQNASNGYTLLSSAGRISIAVKHNMSWTASLESVSWIRIDSTGVDSIYLSYDKNHDEVRNVTLTVKESASNNSLMSSTVITQEAPGLVLNEDFGWLDEGEAKPYYQYPEVAYSKWNDAEKGMGWTTIDGWLYGGRGYIKLGKTSYAGDAVSPALVTLQTTSTVDVSFQAIGYVASNGNKDDAVIKVGVIGPGMIVANNMSTIDINGKRYNCARFECTVFPNSANNEYGAEYNPWAQAGANFNFQIKGATKDTQIVFIGGDKWNGELKGVGQGKNRVLIDNLKVKEL